jgi:stage II sporulation protein D
MRRFVLALTAVLALAFCSSAAASPVFFVWGKGWGHGIGMPQWGAKGYADHGKDYTWILDHYYTGTEPGPATKTTIRVLLDVGRSSVVIASPSTWTIADADGKSFELAAGSKTFGSGLRVWINGARRTLSPPVTVRRPAGPLTVDGRRYRGSIVLRKPTSALAIVNEVGLQPYLYGVVPWEMPADWHMEALKVQAVAARSYGLANTTSGTYFDVYDDTRDQVYGGFDAEHPRSNEAVQATANEVRTYNGNLATTYFYSSSGGWTANNEDVWPSGTPVPYLRSVRDYWDSLSPHHTWGPTRYSRASLDARLGGFVQGTLRDIVVDVNASRRAGAMIIHGSGGTSSMPGWQVRDVVDLKSSWFRVGVLNLLAGRGQIERGQSVRLSGKARAVGAAWLESRVNGGAWTKVKDLVVNEDARFATTVKPASTRSYRVASAKGASNPVSVTVTARVRFAKPSNRSGLSGVVAPAKRGTLVTVQRRAAGAWGEVARDRTDASGRFEASFELVDGTYRAMARAGGGAESVSPTLRIVG